MSNYGVNMYKSAIDLSKANADLQYFVTELFRNLIQIGNEIFLVCSAWFLIDNNVVNKLRDYIKFFI